MFIGLNIEPPKEPYGLQGLDLKAAIYPQRCASNRQMLESDEMSKKLLYLACPYTHPDMAVRIARFEASARAAAYLIHQGHFVYSPITMTHPIDLVMATDNETMGSDYWVNFDKAFMDVCSEMIILAIPGWADSRGISREVLYFKSQNKPVRFLNPDPLNGYIIVSSLDEHN